MKQRKRDISKLRAKMITFGLTVCTLTGAFFMAPSVVSASEGNGRIEVEIPQGWQKKSATCQVKPVEYTVVNKEGKEVAVTADKVTVSVDGGEEKDITDAMVVTIDHNCKIDLQVCYSNGDVAVQSYDIKNFDLELPSIKGTIDGEVLYLSATDGISGVKGITVNGKTFTELTDGAMCINVKELENTSEEISVCSLDVAGNQSKKYKIMNPYYVGEEGKGSTDQGLSNPDSVEASNPTEARGTITDDKVNTADGVVTQEFYTISANEKVFYLVVDKTTSQDNVYLLTEAGQNDLLNFVNYDGVDVQNGDVPLYEITSGTSQTKEAEEAEKGETEEVKKTETKNSKKSNSSLAIILIVSALAVGFFFVKKKKGKENLDEAEEIEAFDTPEDDFEEIEIETHEEEPEKEEDTFDDEILDLDLEDDSEKSEVQE